MMRVYEFWSSASVIIQSKPITKATDRELADIAADTAESCPHCGESHVALAEQARIVQIARAHGWPTERSS